MKTHMDAAEPGRSRASARRAPLLLALALAACSQGSPEGAAPAAAALRLGYFANVTHAPALIALDRGLLALALGPDAKLEPHAFNAGPEAVEALFSGALDATYIGPNPAINAFARSHGEAIRIVAGCTSGGASLVVTPAITSPEQLRGAKLATPQLGNTQDVALRTWLRGRGLAASLEGGGEVSIVPQANAQTLETFRAGEIQGAWVPEPWASRLVLEGGGSVLVDERSLWPDGRFVTTHLIVRTAFLREQPELVARLLRAHVQAVDFANASPAEARETANAAIARVTGQAISPAVLERAWSALTFTVDPIASSLRRSASDATAVGLLDPVDLAGIYELGPLDAILAAAGRPPVPQ
jgi:NitT/TauT family transport system substrate-binding protein